MGPSGSGKTTVLQLLERFFVPDEGCILLGEKEIGDFRLRDWRSKMCIRDRHQGDKEARDALVTENMGLIWSIVRRFAGRGYDLEDLFQIGSIGLMKAIDKFDLSMDCLLYTSRCV